MMDVMLTITWN